MRHSVLRFLHLLYTGICFFLLLPQIGDCSSPSVLLAFWKRSPLLMGRGILGRGYTGPALLTFLQAGNRYVGSILLFPALSARTGAELYEESVQSDRSLKASPGGEVLRTDLKYFSVRFLQTHFSTFSVSWQMWLAVVSVRLCKGMAKRRGRKYWPPLKQGYMCPFWARS